ncbi:MULTISPECIES: DUF3168 domain-containing protein [Sphingomonas]|uniref:DUF3168 domain-containing protein n=1 Tax=Edaphosphingomonas fennica TaxID=114404 RepID=A0A2T4HMF1_9SPHN|nr:MULTISPECIES: DUF3168 domain-containing protein [Sphingomonas]AGH51137.1 hypothetical protein G432_17095 [Sphingomonas sp. MM-1]MDX3885465.1 DUF3168 domain-containing protein [Sphingomonas sp.]PTD16970.1 DUF3168 domain-containing protein [Sphingomonas fennica]
MSAMALQAALVTALSARLGTMVSGIFDGPPVRAAFPYVSIGGWASGDWSHKTGRGREHRLAVTIWDDGGRPGRLHGLMAEAEAAIEGIGEIAGAELASIAFVRSRIIRDADGPWAGIIEYRVRVAG